MKYLGLAAATACLLSYSVPVFAASDLDGLIANPDNWAIPTGDLREYALLEA